MPHFCFHQILNIADLLINKKSDTSLMSITISAPVSKDHSAFLFFITQTLSFHNIRATDADASKLELSLDREEKWLFELEVYSLLPHCSIRETLRPLCLQTG